LSRPDTVAEAVIFGHMSAVRNEMAHPDTILRPSGSSPAWLHAVVTGAAFLAAYLALEWISFIHEYKGLPVTPWNPGLGVVFALMLYAGAQYGVVLFVGVLIAEIAVLRTNLPWPFIIGIATVIAVGYGAVAFFARRRFDVGLNRLRDVLVLLAAGAVGAVLVASLLSLLLVADEKLNLSDVFVASGPLLVGDAIGIAVMTPLVLRLILHIPHLSLQTLRALAPEVSLYVAVVLLFLWFIGLTESESGFKLFYLFFLPVVIAAIRYGLDGACLGLALTQFGLVGLLHLHGYDANVFTEFQILMLVLTATGLTVGVTVDERQQAHREVRKVEALLRAKEAEAAQAARFNLVSSMASALAHEINQPITAARALGRAAQHLLHNDSGSHTRVDDNLSTMIAQIDHAASVVKRMREFLRRGEPHISTLNVRTLIDEAMILVGTETAGVPIRIDVDVATDLPPVHADRVQLQQVVLNLMQNSIDAIGAANRSEGRIRVAAALRDDPPRVEIAVSDNGAGIAPALAERLFEPLTTSKRDGLGLGLSICATIVQSHHGRLWLQSGAPGATEFRFWLPLQQATPS
jgi:two-component system, LuxR family, sensor kinase FixL